jgi:hypothetical protein
MSVESIAFEDEVACLKELGLTHTGVVYALGCARTITGLQLRVLAKVLKDLPVAEYTDEQLMHVSSVISTGKVGEAKQLITGLLLQLPSEESGRYSHNSVDLKAVKTSSRQHEVYQPQDYIPAVSLYEDAVNSPSAAVNYEEIKSEDALAGLLDATVVTEFSNLLGPDDSDITCYICTLPISEDDLLPLDSCGHLLHSACTLEYIKSQVRSMSFPVNCPLPDCHVEIGPLDLKERLDSESLMAYEQGSFTHYVQLGSSDLLSCPTQGCGYVFSWTGEGPEFECPMCTKDYCLTCKTFWHKKMTCAQYHSQLAAQQLAPSNHFKQCAVCSSMVGKAKGSTQLICTCGYSFCFNCGEASSACCCRKAKKSFFGGLSSAFKNMFR